MSRGGGCWFTKLFGFAESGGYAATQSRLKLTSNDDGTTSITSIENGEDYNVGRFSTPSLAELRAEAEQLASAGAAGDSGHDGVLGTAQRLSLEHVATGDVFCLHTDPANAGAMFQAASQFNCLEMASPRAVPEDGVTIYQFDGTQGPACSLAAAPATVFRNYFAKVGGPDAPAGQVRGRQLNNLHDMLAAIPLPGGGDANELVRVANGYSNVHPDRGAPDATLAELAVAMASADPDQLRDRLRIGVHSRVEVPFSKRFTVAPKADRPTVSQAFCSALACGYSYGDLAGWEPLGRAVLEASYEAVLWAALIEQLRGSGSGVVFLTFIGGGVFGNEAIWIDRAIGRACAKLARFPLDVKVCHYGNIGSASARRINDFYADLRAQGAVGDL